MTGLEIKVKMTLTEEALGMMPAEKTTYEEQIAVKAPDPELAEEEAEDYVEPEAKGKTVFPRLEDGTPYIYDYQIRGMFKDAMGMLRKVPGTESSKIKAYKKAVDGMIFVKERKIPIELAGEMGTCERPLRAQTPKGERIALAASETVPALSVLRFTLILLDPGLEAVVRECLDYGVLRGIGQWRNSGKGRFLWEEE